MFDWYVLFLYLLISFKVKFGWVYGFVHHIEMGVAELSHMLLFLFLRCCWWNLENKRFPLSLNSMIKKKKTPKNNVSLIFLYLFKRTREIRKKRATTTSFLFCFVLFYLKDIAREFWRNRKKTHITKEHIM